MSLERIVKVRDAVRGICRAIDAGEVAPSEIEMVALATVVAREAGPLAHTLLCELASRCRNGRKALDAADRAPRG